MVPTALPRSYIGQYTRFRVEIESHNAIGDEKKKIPYRKKKNNLYRLLLCEKWKLQTKSLAKYNTQHSNLGGVLIILTNIIINSFSYALPL